MHVVFKNIRFWILLFFAFRLIGITNPPLEISHSWRQSTGLMVARNFLEIDNNILYPRIDDHEGWDGIVGMEFPLLNYSHYLVSTIFGYTHWYGRLINLIVSCLGIWFFYLLVIRLSNGKTAFYATLALLSSAWFMFSRKTMPDTFSLALVLASIYYAYKWVDNGLMLNYMSFFVLLVLGVMSKLPAIMLLALLIPMLSRKSIAYKRLILLAIPTIASASISYWWYFIRNPKIYKEYGIWYNEGGSLTKGWQEITGHLGSVIEKLSFNTFYSFVFIALAVLGLVIIIIKEKSLRWFLIVFVLGFGFFAVLSGRLFHVHTHYILPLIPILALCAGYALSSIKYRYLSLALLTIGVIEGVANQQHDLVIPQLEQYKLSLEQFLNENIDDSAEVAISSINGNHQTMYLAHRKGWMIRLQNLTNDDELQKIKKRGGDFVVLDKHITNTKPPLKLIAENKHHAIYKL